MPGVPLGQIPLGVGGEEGGQGQAVTLQSHQGELLRRGGRLGVEEEPFQSPEGGRLGFRSGLGLDGQGQGGHMFGEQGDVFVHQGVQAGVIAVAGEEVGEGAPGVLRPPGVGKGIQEGVVAVLQGLQGLRGGKYRIHGHGKTPYAK